MATSQSEEAATLLQSALNALPMQVAVLDREGVIRYTNRAWRTFGTANGLEEPVTEGADYLGVCADADDSTGPAAAEGIRAVLAGERDAFSLEYDCHGPDEKRWFQMEVTRFDAPLSGPAGGRNALVAHLDVTDRKLAERAGTGDRPLVDDPTPVEERVPVDVGTLARSVWAGFEADATLAVESTTRLGADQSLLECALRSLFRSAVDAGYERVTVTADGEGVAVLGSESAGADANRETDPGRVLRRVADAHGWTVESAEEAAWGVRVGVPGSDRD